MEVCQEWQARACPLLPLRKGHFRKDRRLNIRLSSKDLEAIQKRALAEGLPYQALICLPATAVKGGGQGSCPHFRLPWGEIAQAVADPAGVRPWGNCGSGMGSFHVHLEIAVRWPRG